MLALHRMRVVCEIALRHLLASRWKTLIVGAVGACAAMLIVVGSATLSSVDAALQRGITGSVAGDIHVYSSDSKDDFEIMGSAFVDVPDIAPLTDFAKVKQTLLAVPNVAHVVPMGFANGTLGSSSALDEALAKLRAASEQRLGSGEQRARFTSQLQRVRQVLRVMQADLSIAGQVSSSEADREGEALLARANSAEFWRDFETDPDAAWEYLESRVAPLASAVDGLTLRYFGTDPQAFAEAFPRFRVVDGQPIPRGARGFLFSKRVYEEQVKLKAAYGLDTIQHALHERHRRIADDRELSRIVKENVAGVGEIVVQLDDDAVQWFRTELQRALGVREADVSKLLAKFLDTTDENFDARYELFYRVLAPRLSLYRFHVGDVLTIQTPNRRGYTRSVNVKLFGTYTFEGLEQSPQASAVSMMDLVTFRELYGFNGSEQEQELNALRSSVGARDVERANAEALLFGSKAEPTEGDEQAPVAAPSQDPLAALHGIRARRTASETQPYDPVLLQQGSVLDVAVKLVAPERAADSIDAIQSAAEAAGLPLTAISGEQSSGLFGQFVGVMRGMLLAAVLVVFVVTLVVVNNALLMATLERVPELGALRAIGAQRSFVMALLVVESLALGLVAGSLGAAVGKVLVAVLGRVGIPAWSDVMAVVFSGQRLFPVGTSGQLVLALAAVVTVSCASGIYPAWVATRVSPRRAMGAEE